MGLALEVAWEAVQLVFWLLVIAGIVVASAAGVLAPPVAAGVWAWRKLRGPKKLRAQTFFGPYR